MGYVYHGRTYARQANRTQCAGFAYRRGLLRCSFYQTGQCEGLEVWDGQQVQTPALFLYVAILIIYESRRFWEPADKNRKSNERIVLEKPVSGNLLCRNTDWHVGAVQRLG